MAQGTRKPEEERAYKEGYDAARESVQYYMSLPYLFQQTIIEYLKTYRANMNENQAEKADWFAEFLKREGESEAWSERSSGKGTTKIKCDLCDVEYFSSLLMAYHMIDTHMTRTSKQSISRETGILPTCWQF